MGLVDEDAAARVSTHVEPVGVVAALTPATHSAACAVFKALLCLKTRNALVLCPSPRGAESARRAARAVGDAAAAAGAPPGLVRCLASPSLPLARALMAHPSVALVLATGGGAAVRAAHSCGRPALGVGSGNCPCVVDASADLPAAVACLLASKTFDNGTSCAAENAVVVVEPAYGAFVAELERQGGRVLSPDVAAATGPALLAPPRDGGGGGGGGRAFNPSLVGKSVDEVAKHLGLGPLGPGVRLLAAEVTAVGPSEPWSHEKARHGVAFPPCRATARTPATRRWSDAPTAFPQLCPAVALYRAPDVAAAAALAGALVEHGGRGHTAAIHSADDAAVSAVAAAVRASRVVVNLPAHHAAAGGCVSGLPPTFSLGCGPWGGTILSTALGPDHLLNHRQVVRATCPPGAAAQPARSLASRGCLDD